MLVCALVALAMPAVAAQCCAERPLDLVIAMDRSQSVKEDQWNDFMIPSLNAMLSGAIDWTEQAGKPLRVSLIVYPGENGKKDDCSGLYTTVVSRASSYEAFSNYLPAVGEKWSSCVTNPTGDALLKYPCGGWKFTPTWQALGEAERLFVGATGKKVVFVVTDGLPAKTGSNEEAK